MQEETVLLLILAGIGAWWALGRGSGSGGGAPPYPNLSTSDMTPAQREEHYAWLASVRYDEAGRDARTRAALNDPRYGDALDDRWQLSDFGVTYRIPYAWADPDWSP